MCVCVCGGGGVCACVIEMINPELCRAKHLTSSLLPTSPAEGGSPTDEATKKLVSDIRDQLLQGLADNAETIRHCQVVESFCLSFSPTSLLYLAST